MMGWAPVWPVSLVRTIFRHSAERAQLTGGIEGRRRGEGPSAMNPFRNYIYHSNAYDFLGTPCINDVDFKPNFVVGSQRIPLI
jgi:hypothetical protein